MPAPFRIAFDNARDPYAARNALGIKDGGGAPTDAQYITATADPTLTNERVLTNTASITWDFSTPGQAKATAAGGGNVNNVGTPTSGQYAKWTGATTIQGVPPATVLSDIGAQPAGSYQPLDADLTAIAALTGTNTIYYRSAANTWAAVTIGANLTFTGGTLAATAGGGDVFAAGNNTFTGENYFNLGANLPLVVGHTARIDTTLSLETHGGRMGNINWLNSGAIAGLNLRKSRGGTTGVHGLVATSDGAQINFAASDGTAFLGYAAISGVTDATPAAGVMPGKLQFLTRGSVGGNTVRMEIDSAGVVTIAGTPPASSDSSTKVATTAWVQSAVGAAGGGSPSAPQGRLTLQSLTPVMTTTQAAKTTIFYTPYVGNKIPLYDGTNMVMTTFAELSVATTDTTKNPAAIGANKVNDWFVWNDAGTIRLSHGPDWTNDTTRSVGTGLNFINGIWVNFNNITNGPNAARGTYVGTTRSNASSQLDWIFGSTAAGAAAAAFLGIWNTYNRIDARSISSDTTDSWSVSATSFSQGSAANKASFVCGLAEDAFDASYASICTAGVGNMYAGVGYDVVNAKSGTTAQHTPNVTTNGASRFSATASGFHFVAGIEMAATAAGTFFGDAGGPAFFQSGLHFAMKM
jgi:hypothetical protein